MAKSFHYTFLYLTLNCIVNSHWPFANTFYVASFVRHRLTIYKGLIVHLYTITALAEGLYTTAVNRYL